MATVVYTSDQIVGHQSLLTNGAYTTFTMHKTSGSFPTSGGYAIKSVKAKVQFRNASSDTITFYAGTTNVGTTNPGGVDGSKTVSLKTGYAWAKLSSMKLTGGGEGTQLAGGSYVTVTITWEYIAGTLNLSSNDVTAGETVTATIQSFSTDYTYRIKGKLNTAEQTWTPTASSMSITIPENWVNAMPTSEVETAEFTLTTYSGSTEVGTSTVTVIVSVPGWEISPVPTISIQAATDPVLGADYVQGMSSVKVSMSATGTYGASVSSFWLHVGSQLILVQATNGAAERTVALTEAGGIGIKCEYTDSRGRLSGSQSAGIIQVLPYSAPSIQAAEAERCDEEGDESLDGQYLNAYIIYSYAEAGTNAATVKIQKQVYGQTSWVDILSGEYESESTFSAIGNGAILSDNQYKIRFTVTDSLGSSAYMDVQVPAGEIYMRMDMANRRIGLGTYPVEQGRGVQMNPEWKLYTHGMEIVDLIDSRMPAVPAQNVFGSMNINSSEQLAANTSQTYTGTVTVPSGANVKITGAILLYGSRIAFWAYPSVSVSGTTATFSVTARNDSSTPTNVRCTIYYCY